MPPHFGIRSLSKPVVRGRFDHEFQAEDLGLGAAHYWQLQNAKTYAFSLGVKDPEKAEF